MVCGLFLNGDVAQLVEHLTGSQEVAESYSVVLHEIFLLNMDGIMGTFIHSP